ncbi:MAG: hypothetical protein WBA23_06015 [Tunicatimonas sp.]|uniref:hypothetical protein n=1 Tax=Tunicatimonas sp. TaxID=1940096 RepID=UPI003C73598D
MTNQRFDDRKELLATKDDLSSVQAVLKDDIALVRSELKDDIASVKAEKMTLLQCVRN